MPGKVSVAWVIDIRPMIKSTFTARATAAKTPNRP